MTSEHVLRLADFLFWVAAVAVVVVGAALVLGIAVGEGLLAAKYVLFVVGFLLFGLGSLAIQPAPPQKDERRVSLEGGGETRLEAAIQEVPPLRDDHLPFDARVERGIKLFVASLVVLGVSVLLELGFGVRP